MAFARPPSQVGVTAVLSLMLFAVGIFFARPRVFSIPCSVKLRPYQGSSALRVLRHAGRAVRAIGSSFLRFAPSHAATDMPFNRVHGESSQGRHACLWRQGAKEDITRDLPVSTPPLHKFFSWKQHRSILRRMNLQLEGKRALVTGSSKGIGEAIVRFLAAEGATVLVHGRDRSETEQVVNSIDKQGGKAFAVTGDLTDDNAVDRLVLEAEQMVGAIDILVNNAGGSGPKDTWATTQPAAWASAYDRNVLAAVRATTRVLPKMRQARWGRVITSRVWPV